MRSVRHVTRAWRWCARLALVLCAVWLSATSCRRSTLPAALSDQEFWSLIEALSEPPGTFNVSDNFVSNEPLVAENARRLRAAGGVYIGVGPEQNFTYIESLRPDMAFIIDIRRENRNLHLLYKVLFELSSDRADFISRLFSRPRPAGLQTSASAEELFTRFDAVRPSNEQFITNLALVHERLRTTRAFPLAASDLEWIERVSRAFYTDGPEIHFWGSRPVTVDSVRPSYRWLMAARDHKGQNRSFLSSEDAFRFVKEMQSRNLIVPLVGDFGGQHAVKAVGDYVRGHGGVVRAFYGSNVGVYLNSEQTGVFCRNLTTLPVATDTWFIESDHVRSLTLKLSACPPPMR
jgi:hypothetical protein